MSSALDEFVYIDDDLLEAATPAEREWYQGYLEDVALEDAEADAVDGWRPWLRAVFGGQCSVGFAPHHQDFWRWVWALEPGRRPDAFIGVWNRGGAKSTSAELAVAAVGARQRRRYVLYTCGTQDLADEHVANIGTLLESPTVGRLYPAMASRAVGKFGNPRGWRRNRLATASGFTVDALGLDVASRGVKFDDQRPDLIVIDDVDDSEDTWRTVRRKISRLTRSLLPAGAPDLAVLAIQNLIHADSVFAQLLDRRIDMLARRHVSGPVPALTGCRIENREGRHEIVAGEPTWEGLPLAACQATLDDIGLTAFLAECQHEVARREGTLWSAAQLAATRRERPTRIDRPLDRRQPDVEVDEIERAAVGVDPSGGDGPRNDEQGIVAVGRGADGHGYVLADRSCRLAPEKWGARVVRAALDFDAEVVVETNYGGDMCASTVKTAAVAVEVGGRIIEGRSGRVLDTWAGDQGHVTVVKITATRGKLVRAEPVAALYGDPDDEASWPSARIHHVEAFAELEGEMTSWDPDSGISPNRVDALVWAATRLLVDAGAQRGGLRYRGGA